MFRIPFLTYRIFVVPIIILVLSFLVSFEDGVLYPSQGDVLLFCQSARQFANGSPFVFTPLGELSTGNTTYFYPILLVPYFLFGGNGAGVFIYGFFLNALFYLTFYCAWYFSLRKLILDGWTRNLAMILLATFGQPFAVAMGQTDTGLFMAVTASIFAALLYDRSILFGILLVLSPWCRPEGTILIFSYLLFVCGARIIEERPIRRKEILIVSFAILSALSVFVLNYALTGQLQYQSVSEKGHFASNGFINAIFATFQDFLKMVRGLFLGLEGDFPRNGLLMPLLGGILFVWGLLRYQWGRDAECRWKFLWWIFSGVLTIGIVASSGWQGTNLDRYEGWILPLVPVFIAVGVANLTTLPRLTRDSIAIVLVGFQVCSLLFVFFPIIYGSSKQIHNRVEQFEELSTQLPSNASFGGSGMLEYAFYHQTRYPNAKYVIHNLDGIYSPSFLTRDFASNLEKLKHKTAPRFDMWLFSDGGQRIRGFDVSGLCQEEMAKTFTDIRAVRADWSRFDNALRPPFDTNQWDLLDSIDIGFAEDEKEHRYAIFNRYSGYRMAPFGYSLTNQSDRLPLYDVGKPVIGWDRMDIYTIPSVPIRVFLRTSSSARFSFSLVDGQRGETEFFVTSPSKFQLFVDGKDLGVVEKEIEDLPGVAQVVYFDVPGNMISQNRTRIEIVGDHLAYQYWFATPKQSDDHGSCE